MGQFDASDRPLGREVRAHQPFVKMNRTKLPLLAASGAALLFAGCAQASALSDALEAVIDTTPAGLAKSSASRPGDWASFWSDTKEGARYIMENGSDLWVVPTFTNHPAWNWEDRSEENAYPFGMGLARQVIDDRGNERMFFLVSFVDSNYRVEPMWGTRGWRAGRSATRGCTGVRATWPASRCEATTCGCPARCRCRS